MGKKAAPTDPSNSLKTFYLYAWLVLSFICVSLLIRGIFLFQQNVFNPSQHFTLSVIDKGTVKEIISFNPQIPGITVLKVNDKSIPYQTLAKDFGVTSDGYLQLDNTMPLTTDVTALMWSSIIHNASLHTNLTIFDTVRLFLLSKNVATNNEVITDVTLHNQNIATDTQIAQALTDSDIASESISIQIINATDIAGMGQRLGKVLTNIGANVVDVSSAQNVQKKTTIAYYGDESMTLNHLQKLLTVTATEVRTQPIANIVITIGTDKSNTSTF